MSDGDGEEGEDIDSADGGAEGTDMEGDEAGEEEEDAADVDGGDDDESEEEDEGEDEESEGAWVVEQLEAAFRAETKHLAKKAGAGDSKRRKYGDEYGALLGERR